MCMNDIWFSFYLFDLLMLMLHKYVRCSCKPKILAENKADSAIKLQNSVEICQFSAASILSDHQTLNYAFVDLNAQSI